MREYQQKRKLGAFQSYDINIDAYPHFSEEGKIQGINKKSRWLEKTHAVQLFEFEVSEWSYAPLCVFPNIKTYWFCTHLRLKVFWQEY